MKYFFLSLLFYGILGGLVGAGGLTLVHWQYWAIMVTVMIIDNLGRAMGADSNDF